MTVMALTSTTHASAPLLLATHVAWSESGTVTALVSSLSSRVKVTVTDLGSAGSADPVIELHGFWTPEEHSLPDGPVARLVTDILEEKIDVAEDLESTGVDAAEAKETLRAARAAARRAVHISVDLPTPLDSGLCVRGAVLAAVAVGVDKHAGRLLGSETLTAILRDHSSEAEIAMVGGARILEFDDGDLVGQAPVLSRRAAHWAICLVGDQLDERAVEEKLRQIRSEREVPQAGDPAELQLATAAGDVDRIAELVHNDFTPAVISLLPRLRRTMKFGQDAGALTGIVCGAGTAVAFLCRDRDHALDIAAYVATTGAATWTLAETEQGRGASVDEPDAADET